jgi:GTP-binding protein EngB required for normal cell division
MESLALIIVNLIVLALFGAFFFAKGEVEKDLIHKQRVTTDLVANKMDKLIEKIREQDKSIIELKSQLEALDKRVNTIASAMPKSQGDRAPADPLSSFVNAGSAE